MIRTTQNLRTLAALAVLAATLASVPAAGSVLVWAPEGQASGATDSAAALVESLGKLGIETVKSPDLPGDLSSHAAVLAVLGTFPRTHSPTEAEAEGLAAYLRAKGALYLEGGDAVLDLPPDLTDLLGVSLAGDGTGDLGGLDGLDGSPGPDLGGLNFPYLAENRSIDRLGAAGEGAVPIWRNRATGSIVGIFRAVSRGHRAITVSFEFGGLPAGREEILRSYLIALGALEACLPAADDLAVSVTGRRAVLTWSNPTIYDWIRIERDGLPVSDVIGTAFSFTEDLEPGEHRYAISGLLDPCRGRPAFATAAVLRGAHVIWQPAETVPGPSDGAAELRAALEANGRAAVTVPSLAGMDLSDVAGLWASLGTSPFHHVLTAEESQLLASYLTGPGGPWRPRLYVEGGDTWSEENVASLRAACGVLPVADDGRDPLRHLRGLDTGQGLDLADLVRLPVDYTSERDSIDIIEADPAAPGAGPAWIDDDSDEVLGVFRRDPAGIFAVLAVSFEFGGVTATREERALLMGLYLTVLEGPGGVRFRRGDVDGTGALSLGDPVQLLSALFLGGVMDGGCEDAADADDDGLLGLTDAIVILEHLFLGGSPPPAPGPTECGMDPSEDSLEECRPPSAVCP
jgi:hypothetical protein